MLKAARIFFFVIIFTAPIAGAVENVIVQIGGGNHIDNSQGQIEDNVIWLNRILRKTGMPLYNYFAAGNKGEKDVSLFVEKELDSQMMTLSRVFDHPAYERVQYRQNQVPDLAGSMYKDEITESLKALLGGLTQQQDFLLIYNGHGLPDSSDIRKNYINIWDREKLTVGEVDSLFDTAADGVTLRFIFPQCFSGGFYHLIFDDPHSSNLSNQNRCGFMAESPYDQSEGCSLSTNKEEYRDYSTYFFAPLNGKTRVGGELPLDPDLNADGVISFSESHIYAIKAGKSKDLSRSTSEVYLEEWTPWYLRWGRVGAIAQNQYRDIAEYIANRDELELNERALSQSRRVLKKQLEDHRQETKSCEKDAKKIAEGLKHDVEKYWPELLHPYTSDYKTVIESQSEVIAEHIRSSKDYPVLVATQDRCSANEKSYLELERELAQVEKILRYINLANTKYFFDNYASEAEKADYQSLLSCEEGAFFTIQ